MKILRNIEKRKEPSIRLLILLSSFPGTQTRGRTGMDVTPLVFETSASTDSAIWASFLIASAKVHIFFNSARNTDKKVEKKFSNTI